MSAFQSVQLKKIVRGVDSWNPSKAGAAKTFHYIDLSAVDQDSKRIVGAREILCEEAPSRARQLVEQNDVLVATVRPNLNGVAIVPSELHKATASTGFCVVRPDQAKLAPNYLFHWVKTKEFVSAMVRQATGASYPAVSDKVVLSSQIPLPPLPEQHRIAAILDKADALRAKRQEALAQLDSLAQSIFVEMFGDPITNPSALPIVPLLEVALGGFQNGAYFPKENYSSQGIEMVHMSDAFGGVVERGNLKRVLCENEDAIKYALDENDLLIARRSLTYDGAAKPCRVPQSKFPLIFESSFIRIRPDLSKVTTAYLFHYLNSERVREKFVRPYVTQSTISGINQSNLARIPLVLPSLESQQKFSIRLEAIQRIRVQQTEALRVLDTLFESAQHRAFRGEL